MAGSIASSSTVITTALESIGFFYQSFVLDVLSNALLGPVAVVVFVGGAILALGTFLLTGRPPKQAAWLLIGPPLFFGIITSRTATPGAVWKFGQYDRNQAQAQHFVEKYFTATPLADGTPREAKVSSLFLRYDYLISSYIRQLINFITDARENIDSRFILRTELAASLRSETISDKNLRELIHGPLLRSCANMISTGKLVRPGPANTPVIGQQIAAFNLAEKELVNLKNWPLATQYVAGLIVTDEALYQQALRGTTEQLGEQIASQADAQRALRNSITPADLGEGLSKMYETYTCSQIWSFAYIGLFKYAIQISPAYLEGSMTATGSDSELLKDLLLIRNSAEIQKGDAAAISQNRTRLLYLFDRVLANYLLRNESGRKSGAAFLNEYSKKGFEFKTVAAPGETDLSYLERNRLASSEWQEKGHVFSTAASLPYYQGLALYFLAILFPFFAVLLLIPSRFMTFSLWFLLWFWVKSWDVGYAVVMMIDDLLYTMFMPDKMSYEELSKLGLDANLAEVMWSLRELDPSFQLTTYYAILGGCLAGIPVVSSLLIMGSLKGGAGLIVAGARDLAASIGAGGFIGRGQRAADLARLVGSYSELDRTDQKIESAMSGQPTHFRSDLQPNDPLIRNSYQGGNDGGVSTRDKFNEVARAGREVGRSNAITGGGGLNRQISGDQNLGDAGVMENFYSLMRAALGGAGTVETKRKVLFEQRANYLRKSAETDLAKRTASAAYEGFITPELQHVSALGRISGMIEVPVTAQDGDEEEFLKSEYTMLGERANLAFAPIIAQARSMPSTVDLMSPEGTFKWKEYLNGKGQTSADVRNPLSNYQPAGVSDDDGVVSLPVGTAANIRSNYGMRADPFDGTQRFHSGIDITVPGGTPTKPTQNGWVVFRGFLPNGFGNQAAVMHDANHLTLYGHFSSFPNSSPVQSPERVFRKDVIGFVGSTGRSTGDHLHLSEVVFVNVDGHFKPYYVNPKSSLDNQGVGAPDALINPQSELGKNLLKWREDFIKSTGAAGAPVAAPPQSNTLANPTN